MELLDSFNLGLLPLLFLMFAAFLAGVIDSVAGGGGLISLPAMLVSGVPPQMALGTGKFMSTLGTTAALINFARSGTILWRTVAMGGFFSFAGSALGAQSVLYFNNELLGKIIIFLLPLAAAITFMPARPAAVALKEGSRKYFILIVSICTVIGFYDGFFGPATGSFMLLSLHCILGLGLIAASATTKAFNLASNASGLVIFLWHGKVLFYVAIPMAIANIAGNLVGSKMAIKGGPAVVKRMLLLSLFLLFGTLIWRYYLQ